MRCIYFAASGPVSPPVLFSNTGNDLELLIGSGPTQVKAKLVHVSATELATVWCMPEALVPNCQDYFMYDGQVDADGVMAIFVKD